MDKKLKMLNLDTLTTCTQKNGFVGLRVNVLIFLCLNFPPAFLNMISYFYIVTLTSDVKSVEVIWHEDCQVKFQLIETLINSVGVFQWLIVFANDQK